MTTEVFIALGSNLGDRAGQLRKAIESLAAVVALVIRSPVYETAPQYVTDQPAFLNMVLSGETELEVLPLLEKMQHIEKALGRVSGQRFGPRAIDLDILFFGDSVVDTPLLEVPHPRLGERRFVLQPLNDIAPAKCHPITGMSVAEMLAALPPDDDIRLFPGKSQN